MPGMNGSEFVRKVREIIPTIKVLLMSAFEVNSVELSEDLRGNKIDAFIQKPITLDELGNIVQAQLKKVILYYSSICYVSQVYILTSDTMLIS
jgi:two-component SAPR family response regulator